MGKGHPARPGDRNQAGAGEENAALADRPLDLVLAMLAAYPKLGKSLFSRKHLAELPRRRRIRRRQQALLTALLASPGRCGLTTLSGTAYDMIAARYVLRRLTEQQHDSLRRTIAVDIRIAMSALNVLGMVVLDSGTDQEEADGSAELTALGRYAVRRLQGMAQPGDPLLEVRITLADVADPQVWRRVLIPSAYSLDRVHTRDPGDDGLAGLPSARLPTWRRDLRRPGS